MKDNLSIYKVVKKLVGAVEPVGETTEDDRRFDNLQVMTELVDLLLSDIDSVAQNKNRGEYSMKRAGVFASDFFTRLGID
jgi:hypothetical protein